MAAEPARICVVGSCNIDLTFRIPRLPAPGETLAGGSVSSGFGGKGANQAVMAARLGARVAMVGRVGRDVFGADMLRELRTQGIDTGHVSVDAALPTGTAAILVDDAARNCIVVVAGANGALSPADVERAASAIRSAQVLLCQLEVPVVTTLAALRLARAAGVRAVLNPAPAVPLPNEALRLASLCVPNETELDALTGRQVTSLEQAETAARALHAQGAGAVTVTMGARGALVVDEAGVDHIPAVPVTAVDPTGAGDAFIGALGVFLAEGRPVREAARRAGAVAALSVTRPGAQASFPSRAEVEAIA